MSKEIKIGLFGFGVVGEGIYKVLQQTPSLNAKIQKICIKDPEKERSIPRENFTTNYDDILNDESINVVVELISDADEAWRIVSTALKNKKAVVSANKKMIAENLPELLSLQEQYNAPLLYEAAVCGSIPIIRNLEEYYDNDLLESICGIVNGSTNFILTKMFKDHKTYRDALAEAQVKGFAEKDPKLDVEGYDAANKLSILLLHAQGVIVHPSKLLRLGINRIHAADARLAKERGLEVKLTAQAKKLSNGTVAAFVLPQLITTESKLHSVENEFNGVVLQSAFSDKQFLYGKGAGRFPTSSAVLSDISALRYDYRYEYRKLPGTQTALAEDYYLNVYVSFDIWSQVDRSDFEWVNEFYSHEERQYMTGVIAYKKLKNAAWFENEKVSVIVCPDGIIESIDTRKIRIQSLRLAGVNHRDLEIVDQTTPI